MSALRYVWLPVAAVVGMGLVARGGLAQRAPAGLVAFQIAGDAINAPLAGSRGDAARGKAVVLDPQRGNCGICHRLPGPRARHQGDVGPPLAGVAGRLGEGQIRLRVVDSRRINPATIMPSYYRVEGLRRVRAKYAGKPVLSAEEVEDVVAFVMTLKD